MPCDETECRFADVAVLECFDCGQLWLRYAVEYEGVSGSGGSARGTIGEAAAREIRSDDASDYLAGLTGYICGGSWLGEARTSSGAVHWGM